jgi:type IV pilus assembly protein PilW
MKTSLRNRVQAGFSLIEMMIAIVIGLLITIVVGNIFLGSKDTFRTQDDASRLAENARFAMTILNRTIRTAGYAYWQNGLQWKAAWTGKTTAVLAGTNGTGLGDSDSITVAYFGSSRIPGGAGNADGTILDCIGRKNKDITTGEPSTSTFFVAAGADGRPALFCTANSPNAQNFNNTPATASVTRELVAGVTTFQVLYGVDVDGDYSPEYYKPAGAVTAALMDKVVAVRIGLILESPNANTTAEVDTKTYDVFGSEYASVGSGDLGTSYTPPTTDNKRLRKIYTYTIALRGRVE